jgi:hypothetical protein
VEEEYGTQNVIAGIKRDFLSHFGNPRLDLLVWVLTCKLQPLYIRMAERIRYPTGRPRDARSWRKAFKKAWKLCYVRETSPQDQFPYLKYSPDPIRWVCGCPSFRQSRFLICKHLVKLCHPVGSRSFLEVERTWTMPFWKHPTLIPLECGTGDATEIIIPEELEGVADEEEGSDDGFEERLHEDSVQNMDTRLEGTAQERFIPLLRAQKQYADMRFFAEQEKQLAHAVGFMENCLEVERLENSRALDKPTTWGMKPTTMYLRPRAPRDIA